MGVRRVLFGLARKCYDSWPGCPNLQLLLHDNVVFSRAGTRVGGDERGEAKPEDCKSDSPIVSLDHQQTKCCQRVMKLVSLVGLLLALMVGYLTIFGTFYGADLPRCQSVYMYPSYAKIEGFDLRFTPLAQKYHLYLYREQGLDKNPMDNDFIQLDGIPVLFIPGNAGSFKQVRSIAAASAEQFYSNREGIKNPYKRNLDFFAADFNEDFTAFHGRTMLDQAEYLNDAISYILSLYKESESYDGPLPTSVIILGHSMGGVVARILPMLQNHVDGSILSIITLSSPHAASPVTFDGDILKIYQQTNDFWRSQFQNSDSFVAQNVSLISITGGILDSTLPADYTAVEDIIPLANGFTTFSTGIPNVWTPIDHLAIVWCHQLRDVVSQLLLETVDTNSPQKVLPLSERMKVSRRILLSGLEDFAVQDFHVANASQNFGEYELKLFEDAEVKNPMESFILSTENIDVSTQFTKFIFPKENPKAFFSFLTTFPEAAIYFCKESEVTDGNKSDYIACVDGQTDILYIPESSKYTAFPGDSSIYDNSDPFKYFEFEADILSQYDFALLESPNLAEIAEDDFMIASVTTMENTYTIDETPLDIALFGFERVLSSDTFWQTLSFPNLWDSLISYKLHISVHHEDEKDFIFQPFIRQWNTDPAETKWHVNVGQSDPEVYMHNIAPFIPLEETHDKALKLTVFLPPHSQVVLRMKTNWRLTLKMLFIRYRLTFLALPISIVSIIMSYQFFWYHKSLFFMDFQAALSLFFYKHWILIMFALVVLSPLTNTEAVQKLLFALDPIGFNRPFLVNDVHIRTNFYYLGIRSWFMSGLGILFTLMTIGVLILVCQLFQVLENTLQFLKRGKILPSIELSQQRKMFLGRTRLVTSLFLILAVIFYIPYQLATAICLIIQIGTCIRIALVSQNAHAKEYTNVRNYNFSVFLLMALVVAVDAPIIVVFLHNVAIKWETPFKSHHNCMAVAPMILLVGVNSRLNIPRYAKLDVNVTIGLLSYMGVFSLIYGTRNLYWTHHLCNITCAWLVYGMRSNTGQD